MNMMRALDGAELLALWERGLPRHALDRAALLAAAARPDWPPETIADRPLGAVQASLLRLRAATFGRHIEAHADCRQCGERLAFTLDVDALLQDARDDAATSAEVAGLQVRAPSLRDLAAVATLSAERATRALLARCTLAGQPEALDDTALRSVEDALETLDPQADCALALRCVGCGRNGTAQLDAAALLWDEIEVRALALLRDVHLLASAYGWSEPQVLALSTARRARYLAMCGGPS